MSFLRFRLWRGVGGGLQGKDKYVVLISLIGSLLYPVWGVVALAFLMPRHRFVDSIFTVGLVGVLLSSLFYFRPYGIEFSPGAGDDASAYAYIFNILAERGYFSLFELYEDQGVAAIEPLYWLIYYVLGSFQGFDVNTFVFLNYFLPIVIVLSVFRRLFSRAYLLVYLVGLFWLSSYEILTIHIYRQSLATAFFMVSLYFLGKSDKELSLIAVFAALMCHFSSALFVLMWGLYAVLLGRSSVFRKALLAVLLLFPIYGAIFYSEGGEVVVQKAVTYSSKGYFFLDFKYILRYGAALVLMVFVFLRSFRYEDQMLRVFSFFSIAAIVILTPINFTNISMRYRESFDLVIFTTGAIYYVRYFRMQNKLLVLLFVLIVGMGVRMFDENFLTRYLLNGSFGHMYSFSVLDAISLERPFIRGFLR